MFIIPATAFGFGEMTRTNAQILGPGLAFIFNKGWCGLSRRSNQSILKQISPGCSLEGLMLKLKPQ